MPPSRIQIDILRLLASHRNLESFVAGATALNQDGPRFSGDIDIFSRSGGLSGKTPVQPDPAKLASYTAHAGRRGVTGRHRRRSAA